jgi:hypothetical protein
MSRALEADFIVSWKFTKEMEAMRQEQVKSESKFRKERTFDIMKPLFKEQSGCLTEL